MQIDTRSHLTVDIRASIARAYDSKISRRDRELTRQHLAYMLTQYTEPNTLIAPTLAAIQVIDQRHPASGWHTRPAGLIAIGIFVGVTAGVIVGLILYKTHWNSAEPEPAAIAPAAPVKP